MRLIDLVKFNNIKTYILLENINISALELANFLIDGLSYHITRVNKTRIRLVINHISGNPNLDLRLIESYRSKYWCWPKISTNPSLTIEFIRKNINKNWDWYILSKHPNIKMKDIDDNPNLPWCYDAITGNPNLSIEFLRKNVHRNWSWLNISNNTTIPISVIKANIDLPWIPEIVYTRHLKPVVTDFDKDVKVFVESKDVEFKQHFSRYLECSWFWWRISEHDLITTDVIERINSDSWSYYHLSKNCNITIEYIGKHQEKEWSYTALSKNSMKYEEILLESKKIHRILMISICAEIECIPYFEKRPGKVWWIGSRYLDALEKMLEK